MWTTRLYFHKLSSSWFSFVKYKLSFPFLDSILMLYICLVTSNLQYVYIAWNSIATTEANRPSRVWFGLLKSSFFMLDHGGGALDALFLIILRNDSKICTSIPDTASIHISTLF
jgi:hypothetical protein